MPGKQKRAGKDSSLEEVAASTLEAAWRFPPAQRLFVLFLEAADSHRLNKSLLRQAQPCDSMRATSMSQRQSMHHLAHLAPAPTHCGVDHRL